MENSSTCKDLKNAWKSASMSWTSLPLGQQKLNRANNMPFMKKPLTQPHIKRRCLWSQFLTKNKVNKIEYISQCNYWVSIPTLNRILLKSKWKGHCWQYKFLYVFFLAKINPMKNASVEDNNITQNIKTVEEFEIQLWEHCWNTGGIKVFL